MSFCFTTFSSCIQCFWSEWWNLPVFSNVIESSMTIDLHIIKHIQHFRSTAVFVCQVLPLGSWVGCRERLSGSDASQAASEASQHVDGDVQVQRSRAEIQRRHQRRQWVQVIDNNIGSERIKNISAHLCKTIFVTFKYSFIARSRVNSSLKVMGYFWNSQKNGFKISIGGLIRPNLTYHFKC